MLNKYVVMLGRKNSLFKKKKKNGFWEGQTSDQVGVGRKRGCGENMKCMYGKWFLYRSALLEHSKHLYNMSQSHSKGRIGDLGFQDTLASNHQPSH